MSGKMAVDHGNDHVHVPDHENGDLNNRGRDVDHLFHHGHGHSNTSCSDYHQHEGGVHVYYIHHEHLGHHLDHRLDHRDCLGQMGNTLNQKNQHPDRCDSLTRSLRSYIDQIQGSGLLQKTRPKQQIHLFAACSNGSALTLSSLKLASTAIDPILEGTYSRTGVLSLAPKNLHLVLDLGLMLDSWYATTM